MTTKGDRRALRLDQKAARERDIAGTTPRDLAEDVSIRGIGFRWCQIARVPSFEPVLSWDIRELPPPCSPDGSGLAAEREFRLYRSHGTEHGSRMLVGYREVPAPPLLLAGTLERIATLRIPLVTDTSLLAVADGVRLELFVHISPSCHARFSWVEGTRLTGWRDLDALANETLQVFERLAVPG